MKTIVNLICAATLMSALSAVLVACNEPKTREQPEEPEVIGVVPVPNADVPEEVTAFFEKHPVSTFKFFDEIEGYEPVFLTLNSQNEFSSAASLSVELPHIDFNNYTLIVGSHYTTGGVYLKSHSVDTKSEAIVFNLVYGDTGKGLAVMNRNDFWSLYPKLPRKKITINYVTIKEYEEL